MTNKNEDIESPYRTPLAIWNGFAVSPFIDSTALRLRHCLAVKLIHPLQRSFFVLFHQNGRCTWSNAFVNWNLSIIAYRQCFLIHVVIIMFLVMGRPRMNHVCVK